MKNPIYPEEHPKDSEIGSTRYLCKVGGEGQSTEGFAQVCLTSNEIPKSPPVLHVAGQLPSLPQSFPPTQA